jgi:hypothetical protein
MLNLVSFSFFPSIFFLFFTNRGKKTNINTKRRQQKKMLSHATKERVCSLLGPRMTSSGLAVASAEWEKASSCARHTKLLINGDEPLVNSGKFEAWQSIPTMYDAALVVNQMSASQRSAVKSVWVTTQDSNTSGRVDQHVLQRMWSGTEHSPPALPNLQCLRLQGGWWHKHLALPLPQGLKSVRTDQEKTELADLPERVERLTMVSLPMWKSGSIRGSLVELQLKMDFSIVDWQQLMRLGTQVPNLVSLTLVGQHQDTSGMCVLTAFRPCAPSLRHLTYSGIRNVTEAELSHFHMLETVEGDATLDSKGEIISVSVLPIGVRQFAFPARNLQRHTNIVRRPRGITRLVLYGDPLETTDSESATAWKSVRTQLEIFAWKEVPVFSCSELQIERHEHRGKILAVFERDVSFWNNHAHDPLNFYRRAFVLAILGRHAQGSNPHVFDMEEGLFTVGIADGVWWISTTQSTRNVGEVISAIQIESRAQATSDYTRQMFARPNSVPWPLSVEEVINVR